MTTLSSFFKTDLVDDHEAADINVAIANALRTEYANTETITATKELTDNDCQFQIITASGADRTVELPPEATTNHPFIIFNAGASNNVVVKDDSGATTYATLGVDQFGFFVQINGEGWKILGGMAVFMLINSLIEDTAPDRTNDFGVTYDASAGTFKKMMVKNYGAYVLDANLGVSVSPADATTYYFGPFPTLGLSTNVDNNRVYIPRAGTITRIDLYAIVAGGASNEQSTISLRLNNTTDTAISTTFALNSGPVVISNTSVTIAVAAGDYFDIKWVTPTWATNPTNLSINVKVFIS